MMLTAVAVALGGRVETRIGSDAGATGMMTARTG
jgi:hypothetical protein